MMIHIGNDWDDTLREEFSKPYFQRLCEFLRQEYGQHTVYPERENVFNALKLTPYSKVKAVIIGQDPYHGEGQAHGLCFSVQRESGHMSGEIPPSLRNMYTELKNDLDIDPAPHGELTAWAEQGVLLLNTVLTVRAGQANSHKGAGWEIFTDEIVRKLGERTQPTAFILWGANARSKASLITSPQHGIFTAAHPSPLSAYNGFFGCRHFSKVNTFLSNNDIVPIDWHVR